MSVTFVDYYRVYDYREKFSDFGGGGSTSCRETNAQPLRAPVRARAPNRENQPNGVLLLLLLFILQCALRV